MNVAMNVTVKHLRIFIEVARQGSFTQAAERLSLSQPALTIAVGQFEQMLGIRLFDRTTRRVVLTAEGEAFLPTAERLVEDFDTAIADIRAVAERRRGRVGIAALPSVAIRLLPGIVARFTEAYPEIRVHMHDSNASGVQRRVRRNEVDFGIGSPWEPDPELEFTPLLRDRFVMVCRAEHRLGQTKGRLPWRRLSGYPFLGLARDTGIQPLLQAIKDLPEAIRTPHYEVSNIATLEGMLKAGLGITALPRLAVPRSGTVALVSRPLSDPVVEREICLITRRGRSLSPAAESMRELVLENIPED
jgi:DNA-binding transcriptional LysR family regulator